MQQPTLSVHGQAAIRKMVSRGVAEAQAEVIAESIIDILRDTALTRDELARELNTRNLPGRDAVELICMSAIKRELDERDYVTAAQVREICREVVAAELDKRDYVTAAQVREICRELIKREIDALRRELRERDLVTGDRLDAALKRLKAEIMAETHQIVTASGYKNMGFFALIVTFVVGTVEFIGRFFGAG